MNPYPSKPSSAVASIRNFHGCTIHDYTFPFSSHNTAHQDGFSFDPPSVHSAYAKLKQTYSQPKMGVCPAFERHDGNNNLEASPLYEIDKLISQTLPTATTAILHLGQVTPPRGSHKTHTHQRRKKQQSKEVDKPAATTPSRKRRKTTKTTINNEVAETTEDPKRKASLERNRLAAAKCRINKKDETEQLQRDYQDKAVHNAVFLEQIMRMSEEVQQMNVILLTHASCVGCKYPEEIAKHLSHLGTEFYAQQMMPSGPAYGNISQTHFEGMSVGSGSMLHDGYFSSSSPEDESSMMSAPPPKFNGCADFDVHTPIEAD